MNQTRLLRLNSQEREEYIHQSMKRFRIQSLRHFATEYGIRDSDGLTKNELLDIIVAGMNVWAEMQLARE